MSISGCADHLVFPKMMQGNSPWFDRGPVQGECFAHRSINTLLGVLLFANIGPGLFAKGVIAMGLLPRGLLPGGYRLHAASVAFFRGGSVVFPTGLVDLMKTPVV